MSRQRHGRHLAWLLVACGCGTRGEAQPIDTAPPVVMAAAETTATLPSGLSPPLVTADEPSLLVTGGRDPLRDQEAIWAFKGPFAGDADPEAAAVATIYDDQDLDSFGTFMDACDIEGDATPELAWVSYTHEGGYEPVTIARIDEASGVIVPYASIENVAGSFGPTLLPDYDGDGVGDLLLSEGTILFQGPLSGTYELQDGIPLVDWHAGTSVFLSEGEKAGDVNGDGYSDVLVAADTSGGRADRAVLLGSADPPREMNGFALYFLDYNYSGAVPSGVVGDLDGDGADDVALSFSDSVLPANDTPTDEDDGLGTVFLFTGLHSGVWGVEDATARIAGARSIAYIGYSVAGMDIDGSGRSDLVLGYTRAWNTGHEKYCTHCGLAVLLDPLAWGPDISILNADLLIEPSRPTDLWGPAFFENTGDGVPDIIAYNSNDWGDPWVVMYDGATLLAKINP